MNYGYFLRRPIGYVATGHFGLRFPVFGGDVGIRGFFYKFAV